MKFNRQIFNVFVVVIGAGILIYDLAVEDENVYLKILGLVLLMFGLYTATQQWTAENREEKDNYDEDDDGHCER